MRKLIFTLAAISLGFQFSAAQTCSQFINAVEGKKMVYNNLDAKGNAVNQVSYKSTKKDAATVLVHSEVTDKKGQPSGGGDSEITCNGNSINVDMKSFIPPASAKQFSNMQVQADAKYLMYPLDLKPGQSLPDGSAVIGVNNGGAHFADININITNRKVEGQESLTLSCGTFDCYKLTYDIAVKVKIGIIGIPGNMHSTEWFSPKLGRMVKTETYDKRGRLAGTMQLTSIN